MIADANQNSSAATSEQLTSEPSSLEGCNSSPNKNFSSDSSTTYVFPENFFESNQIATDNAGSTQPLLEFHLDEQADKQNSSRMNNAKYDFLQANTFSDPTVAPTVAEDPSMKYLHLSATAPSFYPSSYNHNLHNSFHFQTESQTQPIASSAMNMMRLQVRKDCWPRMVATYQPSSYRNPPMSTMRPAPTATGAVPYSNQGFSPMGVTPANIHSFSNSSITAPVPLPFSNGFYRPSNYGTQHKTSNLAVASNTPMLRVNVEYPLNQQINSDFQEPQPMSYLLNDYGQGIHSIPQSQGNYERKYPVQTTNSQLVTGSSVPAIFDPEGYYMKWNNTEGLQEHVSQHIFYDQHGRINSDVEVGGTSGISATQPVLSSSVSRGTEDLRSTRKRRRESPSPVNGAQASPLSGPSAVPAESGSKQDSELSYICRWDGCNRRLSRDTTKLSYSHHLDKYHDFRGNTDQTIIECRWMEPGLEPGIVCRCTEKLQKQSVIKHTAGKHLKLMTTDCPLCGSSQARSDNMFRHFKSCEEFHALGEEEKKELWEVHTAQPFDEYNKSERARQDKTTRKKRKVSKSMKERKP